MEQYQMPAFSVSNFKEVRYGKIRLLFDLRIGPVTLRECAIVVDESEKPKFAAPRRLKEKFSDAWMSVADVDSRFMLAVFETVMAKLHGPKPERAPRREALADTRDAWAEEQEARFERAAFGESGAK